MIRPSSSARCTLLLFATLAVAAWAVDTDAEKKGPPAAAVFPAPGGLNARQVSPNDILLTWQTVPGAKEYRLYVTPAPAPHLAGRPGIVGAGGTSYVIPVPPAIPDRTVFRAFIEAVSARGVTSRRVEFAPVALQRPPKPGGGAQSGTPSGEQPGTTASQQPGQGAPATTPAFAGQSCPAGQFVTGFNTNGGLICARPAPASPGPGS